MEACLPTSKPSGCLYRDGELTHTPLSYNGMHMRYPERVMITQTRIMNMKREFKLEDVNYVACHTKWYGSFCNGCSS